MNITPHTDSAGQPDTLAVQVNSAESVSPSQVNVEQKQPSANGTASADGIPPESKQKTGIYMFIYVHVG